MPGKIPTWTLADRLRKARLAAGITPEQIADELHVSAVTVRNYEGARTRPTWATLMAWAHITGVDPEWLCGDDCQRRTAPPRRRTTSGWIPSTANLRVA